MQAKLCKLLAELYQRYSYLRDRLDQFDKQCFDQILSGVPRHEILLDSLGSLSRYLGDFHGRKCVILIDEYDQPIAVAYRNGFYDDAQKFFRTVFEVLLKVSVTLSIDV
jgi:hypothetical protein